MADHACLLAARRCAAPAQTHRAGQYTTLRAYRAARRVVTRACGRAGHLLRVSPHHLRVAAQVAATAGLLAGSVFALISAFARLGRAALGL